MDVLFVDGVSSCSFFYFSSTFPFSEGAGTFLSFLLDTNLSRNTSQINLAVNITLKSQIIKSQLTGKTRLILPNVLCRCFRCICPLSRPLSPPLLVMGIGLVLRKIKRDNFRIVRAQSNPRFGRICNGKSIGQVLDIKTFFRETLENLTILCTSLVASYSRLNKIKERSFQFLSYKGDVPINLDNFLKQFIF